MVNIFMLCQVDLRVLLIFLELTENLRQLYLDFLKYDWLND